MSRSSKRRRRELEGSRKKDDDNRRSSNGPSNDDDDVDGNCIRDGSGKDRDGTKKEPGKERVWENFVDQSMAQAYVELGGEDWEGGCRGKGCSASCPPLPKTHPQHLAARPRSHALH